MVRYTIIFVLWSLITTPIHAQIEQCEVVSLTDAIVISEYIPCPQLDSFYVEGCHYIYFGGKTVPFKIRASFNKFLVDHYETNSYIPECLYKTEEDPILNYLSHDYTYDLSYSKHERRNFEKRGRIESNDIYKRKGSKRSYVAYSFEGEIVMYKTKRKIMIDRGFNDPIYKRRPMKSSEFAVIKKAGSLRSLTMEEANSMNLKKEGNRYINIFAPE